MQGKEKLDALRAEIADRLELPAGAVGIIKVTISGHGSALIENHRGLAAYSRERVEVNISDGRLRIGGEALELDAMDGDALLVTGRILSVGFV